MNFAPLEQCLDADCFGGARDSEWVFAGGHQRSKGEKEKGIST